MFRIQRAAGRIGLTAIAAILIVCAAGRVSWAGFGFPLNEIPLDQIGETPLDARQQQLEALLKESGGDPYVLDELARIAQRRSNAALAKQLWDRAAKQEPNIPGSDVQLVFADIASGLLERAQKRLEELNLGSPTDSECE